MGFAGAGIRSGGEGGGDGGQGEDDADGHDGGDDTAGGRAPEQVPGVDAGEALHAAQRLRPLVPARGYRYLERHAAPYAQLDIN